MTTKVLYHGQNDQHEFWESGDHTVIIFRNLPSKVWTVMVEGRVVTDKVRQLKETGSEIYKYDSHMTHYTIGAMSPHKVASLLKQQYRIFTKFDRSREWIGKPPMRLSSI